jgi:hypothetical protein
VRLDSRLIEVDGRPGGLLDTPEQPVPTVRRSGATARRRARWEKGTLDHLHSCRPSRLRGKLSCVGTIASREEAILAHPRYFSAEISERGQALYEREIQSMLAASDRGKFLVLNIETGEYELDTDELAAVKRARVKHPDGAFYVLRVGHPTAYRLGLKILAAQAC